jgi:hypothetical protein
MTTQLFERFMLYFEARMATLGEHKVLLLVDNFLRCQIPTIGSRLHSTQLEFLPPNNHLHISTHACKNNIIIQKHNIVDK